MQPPFSGMTFYRHLSYGQVPLQPELDRPLLRYGAFFDAGRKVEVSRENRLIRDNKTIPAQDVCPRAERE